VVEGNEATGEGGGLFVTVARTTLLGTTLVRGNTADFGGGISVNAGTLVIAETCRVTENTASVNNGGGIRNDAGAVSLQGANPSPIVVNNCHENCVGVVAKCVAAPVSCP
jgi:predicted outer membrane repeat protein